MTVSLIKPDLWSLVIRPDHLYKADGTVVPTLPALPVVSIDHLFRVIVGACNTVDRTLDERNWWVAPDGGVSRNGRTWISGVIADEYRILGTWDAVAVSRP